MLRVLAAACALVTVAGCGHDGGAGPGQQRSARASFAVAANAVCDRTNRAIARDNARPVSEDELALSVISSEHAAERGAAKLHKLHAGLGDASTVAIDAFDRAVDRYLTTFGALEGAPFADDRRRAAARLRRSGAALYAAAQAARLRRCGRGANAIADRAVFLAYRDGYLASAGRASDRIIAAERLGAHARVVVLARAFRARATATSRLSPPPRLRSLHRAVQRARSRVARDFAVLATGALGDRRAVAGRLSGDVGRYDRLEGRLLRALRLGNGPGERY